MITTNEMRELEDKSEQIGITKLNLMENAGRGVFNILNERFNLNGKKLLIICYHGNNGGDGFVAARYLSDFCKVDVLFIGERSKLRNEAFENYKRIFRNKKVTILDLTADVDFNKYDIIIDAILGIGIKGDIKEPIAQVIEKFNSSRAYKVSVDVPTGINPDTGEKANKYVKPDIIITFHDIKKGLADYKHKTFIVDIGIPKGLMNKIQLKN